MFELMGLLCLGVAWLVPNHSFPWNSFYNDTLAAIGLALLVLSNATRHGSRLTMPRPAWLVLAVALVPGLQWALGLLSFSGDAFVASLYLAGLATAIGCGHSSFRTEGSDFAKHLSWVMVVAASVSSVIALMQTFHVEPIGIWTLQVPPGMRPYANLAQPNNLATLIGFGAVGLWYLLRSKHVAKTIATALLMLLLVGISLTQSRTALLFGPCVAVVLAIATRRDESLRSSVWPVVAISVCHVGLTFSLPIVQRMLGLESVEAVSSRGLGSVRFQMWPILIDALSDHPWRGFGWLQVGAAELSAASRFPPVGELWLHGHNLFLELLLWAGYPIGIVLVGMIVWWYATRLLAAGSAETVTGMLIITILLVHAMLELPHHYAYFLIPAGLWIGIAEPTAAKAVLPSRWNLLPFVATAVAFYCICKDYPAVERDIELMRFEALHIGTSTAKVSSPEAPFLSSLTALLRFSRTTPEKGMSQSTLDDMRRVVARYPYHGAMLRLATSLALNGRVEEAKDLCVAIRHIHGEDIYLAVKRRIHEQVEEGKTELRELDSALNR